ncbi:MAG: 50S ribosomal protein L4 [Candidatus Zixiibacteriota bacterium]|nr:MAG: 50S ribosomal protein L4 [candidate division Zixibacteria bacterium]
MAEAIFYRSDGNPGEKVKLPDQLFSAEIKEAVVHQYVKTYLRNQRQGTHSTKTRAEVSGGGSKPWRQKGTGRARAGSNTSPIWVGGGVTFGPRPRDHRSSLLKKMKRAALKSAFTDKSNQGKIAVVEVPILEQPQTRVMAEFLGKLNLLDKKVLLLVEGRDENLFKSCNNIKNLRYKRAMLANCYDVLNAEYLLISPPALESLREVYSE